MEVAARAVDEDLEVRQAAEADAERRDAAPEHRRVAHADEVGREVGGPRSQEIVEVVAPDLLLALDDELHVDGELAGGRDEALDGLGVDVDLPLVVDDAATPEPSVAHGRLEGGRDPLAERVDRLHVVVAVHEQRGLSRRAEPLGENGGMPGRGPHLDAAGAQTSHLRREVVGASPHVRRCGGIARDGRDANPLDQLGDEPRAVVRR